MRISKVAFGFTKPTNVFANERILVEIELNDHECEQKALTLAKETAEKFFYDNNPHLKAVESYQPPLEPITQVEKTAGTIEQKFEWNIKNSTSIKELEMFKPLTEKYPILKAAYTQKLRELID